MNIKDVITSVAGGLILFGIVGIYQQISEMQKDIVNVRLELVQYHTLVGAVQKEIEKLNEDVKNGRSSH